MTQYQQFQHYYNNRYSFYIPEKEEGEDESDGMALYVTSIADFY
jgi:hypothetical protein